MINQIFCFNSQWINWFPFYRQEHKINDNVTARGEYFSKKLYFCTTPKKGPAQESSDAITQDSNISAQTQKK